MRNILLAGVALLGVSAYLSEARAQTPPPPPTVFPETTTPGKLDGAAPGSVQINIGFQDLTAIMGQWGTGATGNNTRANPQFLSWFHIFPSMVYTNPAGIKFGIDTEIRDNAPGQNSLNSGGPPAVAGGTTLYIQSAAAYVSSDRFGKVAYGTPNGALDDLGVGTGDDWGNGDFYSWYGPPNAPAFAMADSYDGDVPRQKILYETPTLLGMFKGGVSWQPTDVALDVSTGQVIGDSCPDGTLATCAHPVGLARNRVELAAQLNHTFGIVGVKADLGYVASGVEPNSAGVHFQTVSYGNFGAVLTIAGIELEGSVSSGKFNATGANVGVGNTPISSLASPGDPALSGSKTSSVWTAALGYNMGPYGIGAVYYGMSYDDSEGSGNFAPGLKTDNVSGVGIGGSYVVGPGVTLQLDAYTYETKVPFKTDSAFGSTNGSIIALASYFQF
jgi:predicted porin